MEYVWRNINHNIDLNMKFRYTLFIIDHQIDEKTSHFGIKWDSSKSE